MQQQTFTIDEINRARVRAGLSVRRLAMLSGVSLSAAYKAFHNETKPLDITVYKLAKTVLDGGENEPAKKQ